MKNRRAGAIILLIMLVTCAAGIYLNREFVHDDAYISLRYCTNLLSGNGLTWNPGERVEGYTNFLHILLTAALGATGLDLLGCARTVNFSAFVVMLIFMGLYFRRRATAFDSSPSALSVFVPLLLAASSSHLIAWCWGGLEGPVFTLFVTIGVYLTVDLLSSSNDRKATVAGLAFALAVLCRPDGIVFAAGSFLSLLVPIALRRAGGFRSLFLFGVMCALPLGAHEAWRVYYYGDWLPNTFYAKATGLPPADLKFALSYLWAFCANPPYLLPLGILASVVAIRDPRRRGGSLCVLLQTLAYLCFIIRIGGDHMPAFRLLLPLIPLTCFLIHDALAMEVRVASLLDVGIVCILGTVLVLLQFREPPLRNDPAAFLGSIMGNYVRENFPPGSLIALNTAGSTPYLAPNHTYIDMLGLNDRHIARRKITERIMRWQYAPGHAKGDGAYVLSRKPDYIIAGGAPGGVVEFPMFLGDEELRQSDEFHANYRARRVLLELDPELVSRQFGYDHSGQVRLIYYERIPADSPDGQTPLETEP